MNDYVSWHVELAIRPGMLDAFRALTREMVDCARQEPGVIDYQRFITADGTRVDVYERYATPAAAVAHLRLFHNQFGERFAAMVERRRFTVHGRTSAELRALLDPLGAIYLELLDGVSQ